MRTGGTVNSAKHGFLRKVIPVAFVPGCKKPVEVSFAVNGETGPVSLQWCDNRGVHSVKLAIFESVDCKSLQVLCIAYAVNITGKRIHIKSGSQHGVALGHVTVFLDTGLQVKTLHYVPHILLILHSPRSIIDTIFCHASKVCNRSLYLKLKCSAVCRRYAIDSCLYLRLAIPLVVVDHTSIYLRKVTGSIRHSHAKTWSRRKCPGKRGECALLRPWGHQSFMRILPTFFCQQCACRGWR